MSNIKRMWRNSASMIVLVKNKFIPGKPNEFNYDLLTFKRSEKTSFMKNHVVFPGGATDKWDESKEWINLYKKLGITDSKLKELSAVDGPRSSIFDKKNVDAMDREISLRITAIRETFEELGVLICKTKEEFQNEGPFSKNYSKLDINKWQKLVHNDASQFLKLCEEYEIAPDLWSSYEWSAWLTPSSMPVRYEVVFFIVALEEVPDIYPEPHEVSETVLANPWKLMDMHRNKELWLPPPQMYELQRIRKFNDVEKLSVFSKNRNFMGITLFFPIVVQTKDKWVQILPGDDLYPKEVDYNNGHIIDDRYQNLTADELRSQVKRVHRTEYQSIDHWKLYMNIDPLNGHVNPLLEELFIFNKL